MILTSKPLGFHRPERAPAAALTSQPLDFHRPERVPAAALTSIHQRHAEGASNRKPPRLPVFGTSGQPRCQAASRNRVGELLLPLFPVLVPEALGAARGAQLAASPVFFPADISAAPARKPHQASLETCMDENIPTTLADCNAVMYLLRSVSVSGTVGARTNVEGTEYQAPGPGSGDQARSGTGGRRRPAEY